MTSATWPLAWRDAVSATPVVTMRRFGGIDDLKALQDFTAAMWQASGGIGWMHVGDIPHRIYNGLVRRGFAADEVVALWEDEAGIAGFAIVWPRSGGFDMQYLPGCEDVAAEIVEWARRSVVEIGAAHGHEFTKVVCDVSQTDEATAGVLRQAGFEPDDGEESYVVTRRAIDPLAEFELARGYTVRAVRGPEEAGAVGDVHSSAFGSAWTEDEYRTLMGSPGYDADRELVAVAPDGTFAGFCIVWPDDVNRIGLFEPVGVHADHRRRGIGRALLVAGMERLHDLGMTHAMVAHAVGNPGSTALYAAAGFVPWYRDTAWSTPVSI